MWGRGTNLILSNRKWHINSICQLKKKGRKRQLVYGFGRVYTLSAFYVMAMDRNKVERFCAKKSGQHKQQPKKKCCTLPSNVYDTIWFHFGFIVSSAYHGRIYLPHCVILHVVCGFIGNTYKGGSVHLHRRRLLP